MLFLWSEKILGLTFGKIKDRLKELLFYLKVLKDTGQSSQKLAESLKTIKLENGFFKRVDTKIALRKWITCKSFKLLKI